MGFVIVLATPLFLLAIAFEWWWGWRLSRQGHTAAQTYRWDDAINSISLGVLSQLSAVFTRLFRVTLYTLVFEQVALMPQTDVWESVPGVLMALLMYDFCYYWHHRASHEVALFWGGHVVHHQSHHYNLSTALRQTSSGVLLGWVFYLPMAIVGVTPLIFGIVALIDLLYQFWVHTEHVGKLGWFDRWFCSPSNHRVHHAVNDEYVDRNYGGILVVWDRLFGSFKEEDPARPCVYGARTPLNSWDPLWANLHVYQGLLQDSWHAARWRDKLMVWLRHPGWRPADLAQRQPQAAFSLAQHQAFEPEQSRSSLQWAVGWFVLLLGATSEVLWRMDELPWGEAAVGVLAVTAGVWAVNALLQNRITPGWCAFVQMAALSTAAGACGWQEVFNLAKPLALTLLMFLAWLPNGLPEKPQTWLVRALALSWVGDVLLLYPGLLLPGLVAFLAAHLCYLKLMISDAPLFHSRRALMRCLLLAALVYAALFFNGLPVPMQMPVAVYVVVISLMAAQAWGRSVYFNNSTSAWTAWGATAFMLSDTLLAIDTFVNPLPYAGWWVLSSYYLAQALMVSGLLGSLRLQAEREKKPARQPSHFNIT